MVDRWVGGGHAQASPTHTAWSGPVSQAVSSVAGPDLGGCPVPSVVTARAGMQMSPRGVTHVWQRLLLVDKILAPQP